jgi:hypothetical protein
MTDSTQKRPLLDTEPAEKRAKTSTFELCSPALKQVLAELQSCRQQLDLDRMRFSVYMAHAEARMTPEAKEDLDEAMTGYDLSMNMVTKPAAAVATTNFFEKKKKKKEPSDKRTTNAYIMYQRVTNAANRILPERQRQTPKQIFAFTPKNWHLVSTESKAELQTMANEVRNGHVFTEQELCDMSNTIKYDSPPQIPEVDAPAPQYVPEDLDEPAP